MGREALAALAAAGILLAWSPTALAATVAADQTARLVSITAADGEVNHAQLDVETDAGRYLVTFSDSATAPQAGDGCEEAAGVVTCVILDLDEFKTKLRFGDSDDRLDAVSDPAPMTLDATLGAGEDEAVLGPGGAICGSFPCQVRGGGSADRIVGSDDVNTLFGGNGDDVVIGGDGGNQLLTGGQGDDEVLGGAETDFMGWRKDPGDDTYVGGAERDLMRDTRGADVLHGGMGGDLLESDQHSGPAAPDVLDGEAGTDAYIRLCGDGCDISMDGNPNDGVRHTDEGDNVLAERFELDNTISDDGHHRVLGPGPDRLIGDSSGNWIFSTAGRDVIIGRGGRDLLESGGGSDVVRAADGLHDRAVNCGPGADKAIVDPEDHPRSNCERVVVR